MKRLIAFDLDGTLTESKQAIDPEMANLLQSLSRVAIIHSGRGNEPLASCPSARAQTSQTSTQK